MSNDNTHFASEDKCWKFSAGPTLPKPGPTLAKHVSAAEPAVSKSNPVAARISEEIDQMTKNNETNLTQPMISFCFDSV